MDVSDLVNSDADALAELTETIRTVVGSGTWREAGGPGEMAVADDVVTLTHYEGAILTSLELCERFRVARGLPLGSRCSPRLFQSASRSARAAPLLSRPVSMNFSLPTPLADILARP